jgi:hypothetical protein
LGAGTPRLEITFDMNDEGLLFNMVHPKDNAVANIKPSGASLTAL